MSGGPNPPPQEGTFTRIGEKVAHIATTQFSNIKDNIIAGATLFKDGFQTIGESRGRDDGTYETQEEKQASMERQNQAFDRIDATAKDALIKNIQAHKQIHEDIAHITEDVAGITVGAGKAGWEITKELGELLKTGSRIGGAEMLYDSDVLSEQKEKYYASQQGKEDCELLIGTSRAVVNQTINTAVGTGKMVYHAGGLRGVEEQKNEDWGSLQELNERNIRLGIEQEKHSAGLVEGFDLALPATSHFIRNINDPNSENIGGNFAHAALETTSVIGSIKTVGTLINKTEKLAAQTLKGKAPLHSKSAVNIANSEFANQSTSNISSIFNHSQQTLNLRKSNISGVSEVDAKTYTLSQAQHQKLIESGPTYGKERVGSALKNEEVKIKITQIEDPLKQQNRQIVQEFYPVAKGHGFTEIIDNYSGYAKKFEISNGGILYQIEGSNNGVSGVFEWIIQNDKITHREFVHNGIITGRPCGRK